MSSLLDLWREALITTALVSAPLVIGSLLVGIVTSLVQTATQMNDSSFSFVPKLVVVGLALALAGHAMLDRLSRYTTRVVEAAGDVGIEERQ